MTLSQNCKGRYQLLQVSPSFYQLLCLSFCLCAVRPHGTTRPPNGKIFFAFDISVCFGNCRDNLIFFNVWEEKRVLSMTTCVHLRKYYAQFFLEWGIFQTIVAFSTVNNGGSIFEMNICNINRITWTPNLVRMHYVRIYIKLISDTKPEKYQSFLGLIALHRFE